MKFGEFIKSKRLENNLTMKDVSEKLDISISYLSDVEKGRRNPFELDKLDVLVRLFNLEQEEKNMLMNFAGEERDEVAPDIAKYVKQNQHITNALRTLKDENPSEEEWRNFIERIIQGREEK